MLTILLIEDTPRQPEVYHVDDGRNIPNPHHYIVRFDISVDDASFVHKFKPLQYLAEKHQAGLEREFPTTKVEQVFECRAEQLLNHKDEVVLDNYAGMV